MRRNFFRQTLALMALVATASWMAPGRSDAADAKPAKKDSRPASRPKEATLTAAVTPARARPGEVVTYLVTAKVEAPWHIYQYARTQPEDGPKLTTFDFFDPAGMTPRGEWVASREPIKKKEPAFPTIDFLEYFEDEVTWSLKLQVPTTTRPGKKILRCQASYMICSDANCSFPGQWTLPDVELTVLPALADGSTLAAAALVAFQGLLDDLPGLKPAEKDTLTRARPKGVSLTAEIVPAEAKPGDPVSLKVTARLTHPWHIYKYSKTQPDDGPRLTTFDFFDPAGGDLVPKGDWTPSKPPIKRKDNAFKGLEFLEFYDDEVTWTLPLEVSATSQPGKKAAEVQVGFMICTDANCSPPTRVTLPRIPFAVIAGTNPVATSPSEATAKPAPTSVVETPPKVEDEKRATPAKPEAIDQDASKAAYNPAGGGLLSFLLFCAGGGLFALAMPCVWPMIPVTVNFFVKQGQKKEGSPTGLAVAYCLSIIGTFMGVGLLFSIFFGAASLSKLANNPWLNFGIAGLFFVFGLSLLGLFEIRLPNFLLNASAKGEGRGGLIGVMFMALTLTITSFTCTFPVVGLLLVMASNGYLFYPVIGLATFAAVLAFPFFLLALSPGLLAKMPRSGDWMNTVKVVGGLIEIGAAFKFLNNGEVVYVVPSEAWFNAYAVLTIWVVLALICGIYMLGLFRTDHDLEDVKVGPGRMVGGWVFLSLALFLAPALFGRPPQSKLWYLVVGLLPADAGDLKAPTGGGSAGESARPATSSDPDKAEREQTAHHGVDWGMSYAGALERARAEKKPVLIDFTGVNCANCRLMEQEVLPRDEVVKVLGEFVTIQLYTDVVPIKSIAQAARIDRAEKNLDLEIRLFNDATNPNYVILDPEGNVLGKAGGKMAPGTFVAFMNDALKRFKGGAKVAQAGAGG